VSEFERKRAQRKKINEMSPTTPFIAARVRRRGDSGVASCGRNGGGGVLAQYTVACGQACSGEHGRCGGG
jgi:hypothetical protein